MMLKISKLTITNKTDKATIEYPYTYSIAYIQQPEYLCLFLFEVFKRRKVEDFNFICSVDNRSEDFFPFLHWYIIS